MTIKEGSWYRILKTEQYFEMLVIVVGAKEPYHLKEASETAPEGIVTGRWFQREPKGETAWTTRLVVLKTSKALKLLRELTLDDLPTIELLKSLPRDTYEGNVVADM